MLTRPLSEAVAVGWALARYVFEFAWNPSPWVMLGGSLAAALHGARSGVAAVRVHDVRETVQALKIAAVLSV